MRSLPLLALLLVGCKNGRNAFDGMLLTETYTVSSAGGIAAVEIPVGKGTQFLLTARAPDHRLAVEQVIDPDGNRVLFYEDWADSEYSLTWAIYATADDIVLNWPIRSGDPALQRGTWRVDIATLDDEFFYVNGVDVDVTMQQKVDDDLSRGTLRATIAFADGLADDDDIVRAVEEASERWETIWGEAGLDVEVSFLPTVIDPDLPTPFEGSDDFLALSEEGSVDDIVVLIGEQVDDDSALLGHVGTIPNSLVPTRRSTIAISWLSAAGPDGRFDDGEIALLGETLAHEAGHYTGLFHPVERTSWDAWDSLSDTNNCSSRDACESAFADNLMFPYPVCDFGGCTAQEVLTAEQQGVMQRYTGAL